MRLLFCLALASLFALACGGSKPLGSLGGSCTEGGGCDPDLTCNSSHVCEQSSIGPSNVDMSHTSSPMDMSSSGAPKTVFVTSGYIMTSQLGSISAGDGLCQARAEAADLQGHYQAWLSDASTNAIDHVTGSGPWYALPYSVMQGENARKSVLIFASHAALNGDPQNSILVDETGNPSSNYVWTGTAVGGTKVAQGNCESWTSSAETLDALPTMGQASLSNDGWTNLAGTNVACDTTASLYCFEE